MTNNQEKPTYILGVSAYYHDSAAALIADGRIVAAAHEERFTRKKHDSSFPSRAVAWILEESGLRMADLESVVFYDKPFLKFERLLETYHAFAPGGLRSFLTAMPVWIREKLFMRTMLHRELQALDKSGAPLPPLHFPEHHLSHAASAFFPSPFEEAAVLTIDGVGEWSTTSICKGSGNSLEVLREINFPHSLGLLYTAFTAYCGFKVNSGEYKLMGLAPYGDPDSEETKRFRETIEKELVDIRPDGSYLLNMACFDYATGLRMYNEAAWRRLFGVGPRTAESEDVEPVYMNMALAIQQVTEKIVLTLAATARKLTGSQNLCLAGGVALNCVANGKLLESGQFDKIWVQPASGDAGGALGAALAWWHIGLGKERVPEPDDAMQGAYLGPAYSRDEIERSLKRFHAPFQTMLDEQELVDRVADLLDEGKVVGWFQGRMEYGPRALGGRSILADPRNPEMQKRLNLKIKYREGFRPFAPAVREEDVAEYFDINVRSPYMLMVRPVIDKLLLPLPENYKNMSLWDRLYQPRSTLPAITHIDNSARIQSVSQKTNPRFWALLESFKRRYGCGVIVNTSFNVRGEPIVRSPEDAYVCFMRTEMDCLVLENLIFYKEDQPPLPDDGSWRKEYVLD
ncbi:MAG: carbamoyltransferase [Desulfovibrio sp.]|jgi:carbamoyltransferase|nr:carbamoyltransferase [Desulfovibrio sp.]